MQEVVVSGYTIISPLPATGSRRGGQSPPGCPRRPPCCRGRWGCARAASGAPDPVSASWQQQRVQIIIVEAKHKRVKLINKCLNLCLSPQYPCVYKVSSKAMGSLLCRLCIAMPLWCRRGVWPLSLISVGNAGSWHSHGDNIPAASTQQTGMNQCQTKLTKIFFNTQRLFRGALPFHLL